MFMHHIIMLFQIFNEFYLKIIILSFLIALVKTSFDATNKIKLENDFRDRAELNMKYATNSALFGFRDIWTCKTIWAYLDHNRKSIEPT